MKFLQKKLIFCYFFQSLHSGCENDTPDLTGLHESIVDSDEEDLTHSMDVSCFDEFFVIFYFFSRKNLLIFHVKND